MKSYTDIEQSKKLAEILPIESVDMIHNVLGKCYVRYDTPIDKYHTPAWSLAALLGVLPEGIIKDCYAPNLQKENSKYSIAYGNDELLCIADNPLDAVFEMIMKLHKQNLL